MLHIIKLDSLEPRKVSKEGDYEKLYEKLLRNGGFKGEIKYYETRLREEYPDHVDDNDTVLFGGSRLDAFATDDFTERLLKFAKTLLERGVKLIGICYGHQLIARALGAPVARTSFWELGAQPVHFTDEGLDVFKLPQGAGLQQSHSDQVMELPKQATLLASTELCPIQAYGKAHKFLCVQGHPEFSSEIVKSLVVKMQQSNPRGELYGLDSLDKPHSGPEFGTALARFANSD